MIVESNPDLGFIWIRQFDESVIDVNSLSSKRFHARHRSGDNYEEIWHEADKQSRQVYCRVVDKNTGAVLASDTVRNVDSFVEGPSLLFCTRCSARTIGLRKIPTLIGGKMAETEIDFGGKTEFREIAAIDFPVRVQKYTGVAHWKEDSGVGLGGEFTGWISDDEACVPIAAELKVFVGSIRLELESWIRPGWVPPSGDIVSNH
jgi:hypothetical protein